MRWLRTNDSHLSLPIGHPTPPWEDPLCYRIYTQPVHPLLCAEGHLKVTYNTHSSVNAELSQPGRTHRQEGLLFKRWTLGTGEIAQGFQALAILLDYWEFDF